MSHPPEYPGRRRAQRAASSSFGNAYQGAFEAVMAILVGAGVGYWIDRRFETTPYGVIGGVVIGFAAMVLRLLRLGRELVPGSGGAPAVGPDADTDRGPAEAPALSDVWRDEGPGADGVGGAGGGGVNGDGSKDRERAE